MDVKTKERSTLAPGLVCNKVIESIVLHVGRKQNDYMAVVGHHVTIRWPPCVAVMWPPCVAVMWPCVTVMWPCVAVMYYCKTMWLLVVFHEGHVVACVFITTQKRNVEVTIVLLLVGWWGLLWCTSDCLHWSPCCTETTQTHKVKGQVKGQELCLTDLSSENSLRRFSRQRCRNW